MTDSLEHSTRTAIDALRNLAHSLREMSQTTAIQPLASYAREVEAIADGFQESLATIEQARQRDADAARRAAHAAAHPWRVR